jgi:hypothetical protein
MVFRAMGKKATAATTFTPGEREYIRRELDLFFSTYPIVAEGFQLKTWRGGPQPGQPKVPPPARSLLDRGLVRLDAGSRARGLFFSHAGLVELRAMIADRRLADPVKFAHCHVALWKGLIHSRCKVSGSMLIKLLKLLFNLASRLSGCEPSWNCPAAAGFMSTNNGLNTGRPFSLHRE